MEFYNKLPRNKKEFVLFIAIISILSVHIIAPLITGFEMGFHIAVWKESMKVVPFIWLCVVALVLLTYKPAEWLTNQIITKGDSFRVCIVINILCTVCMMSIFLTIIGTWIGSRQITTEPLYHFFYKWPRNFSISFAVECFIAQPIARMVMKWLHAYQDSRLKE